jgi:hypothetical protein
MKLTCGGRPGPDSRQSPRANNLRILILDSCRDNSLADEFRGSLGSTRGASLRCAVTSGQLEIRPPELDRATPLPSRRVESSVPTSARSSITSMRRRDTSCQHLRRAKVVPRPDRARDTPLAVDLFAGGGSIPLEPLRLGCDAFTSGLMLLPEMWNKRRVAECLPLQLRTALGRTCLAIANII